MTSSSPDGVPRALAVPTEFPGQTESICALQASRRQRNSAEVFPGPGERSGAQGRCWNKPGARLRRARPRGARRERAPPGTGRARQERARLCLPLSLGWNASPSLLLFWRVRVCLSIPPPPPFSIRLLRLALLTHHL